MKLKGETLQFTSQMMKHGEICEEAIKNDGRALAFVPEEMRSEYLCYEAVRQNGKALKYVPDNLVAPELLFMAAKTTNIMPLVPEEKLTWELCRGSLRHVELEEGVDPDCPEKFLDQAREFRDEVLNYQKEVALWLSVNNVPESHRADQLYREWLERDVRAIPQMPDNVFEKCKSEAAALYKEAITYAPVKYRTAEYCEECVRNNPEAITVIPDKRMNVHLCQIAVQGEPSLIKALPYNMRKESVWLAAIKSDAQVFKDVPEHMKTIGFVKNAAIVNNKVVSLLPEEMRANCRRAIHEHEDNERLKEVLSANNRIIQKWCTDVCTNAMGGGGTHCLVCDLKDNMIYEDFTPGLGSSRDGVVAIYSNPDKETRKFGIEEFVLTKDAIVDRIREEIIKDRKREETLSLSGRDLEELTVQKSSSMSR